MASDAGEAQRAAHLVKKRDKEKEVLELRKKKIEESNQIARIDSKFMSHYDAVEQRLKSNTVGLVTLDEMKARQEQVVKEREKALARKGKGLQGSGGDRKNRGMKDSSKERKSKLSFAIDEDDEREEEDGDDLGEESKEDKLEVSSQDIESQTEKKKMKKNPDVDTSFLPDKEREEEENKMREEFREEWSRKQEEIKREPLDITYSYWDGAGHRRETKVKKGNTVGEFLYACVTALRLEFAELRAVTVDSLMFIKEDIILPHHLTFYELAARGARGKSGPLFAWGVVDDVRIMSDARSERNDSHAGKVTLRSWYDKNKHTFPACRWEPYDPHRTFGKYTVSDKMVGVK